MPVLESLSEEQSRILLEFRERLGKIDPVYDDNYLYRFLKAREFNLSKAEDMIREHFRFSQIYGLHTILEDYRPGKVVLDYLPIYYVGTDKFGNAVQAILLGKTDMKGFAHCVSRRNNLKNSAYYMTEGLRNAVEDNQKTGKNGQKLNIIFDLENLRYLELLDKRVSRLIIEIVKLFDLHYPERLGFAYFINTPSYFPPWFNLLKKITNSEPLKKAKLYVRDEWKEELLKVIDADKLPAILGGNLTDPDGNTECRTMFVQGGKIPRSFYLENQSDNFKNEENVESFLVREKSYYNCELFVREPFSTICWSFHTVDYNIGFAVYHVPYGVQPMPKVAMTSFSKSFRHRMQNNPKRGHIPVVPVERIDSHLVLEEGQYTCEKAGTYLLHFDNTFSWITPKQLYYKFEVLPPGGELHTSLLDE